MALDPQNLGRSDTVFPSRPRMIPAQGGGAGVRSFAAGSGELALATPIFFDSGSNNEATIWTNGEDIDGFVWGSPVTLNSSATVLGDVMLAGQIHAADVVLPDGETQNNLNTALRASLLRQKGIFVQGLDQVN